MKISQAQGLPQARVKVKHPALAMFGLMIGGFVGMFSETALNVALSSIMAELHVTQGTAQWLVTGYMLVIGICMPLSGLLTRWFSTKRIVLSALGAFIVGVLISALGSNFGIVLLGRMIQGIGTGVVLPLMFSVAMQIFPPYKLGTIMGLSALVIMFAPAIAPTVTGLVLANFAWNAVFWVLLPFLILAFVLNALYLENVYSQSKTPVDWISIFASTIGFSGIVLGASFASDAGWISVKVLVPLIIGLLSLIIFTIRQSNIKYPILNLVVFRSEPFAVGTLLVMLDFGLILASMYLFPMYLQRVIGLPIGLTGIAMLPGGIVNAAVSGLAGRLYDNHGAKWLSRGGFFIAALGVVILLSTGSNSPLWQVIVGHIVLMIGAPLAMSPSQTYGLNSLAGVLNADGSAILNTLEQIVGALSTAIATSVLAIGTAAAPGVSGLSQGIHYGFIFVLIVAICGFLLAFRVRKQA
ncbi:MAG: DHA2 family efflux MFS transporter permease subunit [Furfurilactobacillus sp.]|nr:MULTISPECIES: DHA2 family efflux MFS transporter permease subunit [Furfurilactobacillus]MCH4011954.1 DHA2 family efflux MFS transporter permease subunit [Furfurilactobacillus sp.]MCH4037846.1 DHA2 family efflux MFS transporter permease subunit [Furfurilactobacillus sp.]MCH4115517.1 DHA2 family efflux MFS transporter permease subunit [Furfurilactobacillus sp.]MCI1341107.1 DHA2 family efflux MFS transporter permease subunit [Furfurilactobacillus sp.]MCI1387924.1 DHA2 family efflux MFS transpo